MPRKIKISKKKVNEPDEFVSTTSLVIDYVKNHYRNIIPVTVAVLAILMVAFGWFYYSKERQKEASVSSISRSSFIAPVTIHKQKTNRLKKNTAYV